MNDIDVAKSRLEMYLAAETAILSGQSYKMGTFSLTRADLGAVQKQINELKREIVEGQSRSRGKRCAFRVVPRDL